MSLTPDPSRKIGTGINPSPSPFLTPRPERRRTDPKLPDWNSNRLDRDKEVNIQVLLRCRPLSDEEQRLNVSKVITCSEHKREVTVMQNVANKQVDRTFTFDKVFGPKAQQRTLFDQAISPIVNEVLDGFNCTVFAYGQTGTGKTYTMEGGMRTKGGDLPADAGVIPRAVRQIFDTLEAQNADYSMKVTFLELYNEEITDLLAPEEQTRMGDDKQKKPISLMEDGRGCVVVRGLEEEVVYSANDIYSLLERGAAKRRTADTLLNKRSSRSHSVFSITIHVKEAVIGEEELIKCGKLNLVDLAGSENISRSGAREARAREAGEINKSLLTLGRVINALVEHSAHIPYRDSKLTRLLRDSLGGKTKTCIIATISPSAQSLDETLSTLDYAYRAKNIKNKPEANQKMSKAVLLKDLYLEIERMKEDVRAARDKNGVYVPHERYVQEEAEKKARIERIEQLENDLNLSEKEVDRLNELFLTAQEQNLNLENDLSDCKINLERSNKALLQLQENHKADILTLKEKEFFISKLLSSENSLIERAKEFRDGLQNASEDISSLFAALDNKEKMEMENRSLVLRFGSHLDHGLRDLHKTILGSVSQQQQQLRCMEEHAASFLASKSDATEVLESRIKNMATAYSSGLTALKGVAEEMRSKACFDLGQINSKVSSQVKTVEQFLGSMVSEAKDVIEEIQHSLNGQKELLAFTTQQYQESLHRSLFSAREISKTTKDFLIDIQNHASKLMTALDESHKERSQRLDDYEKLFTEEAAREEKQALDKIAAILANMTSKKTALVSEVSRNLKESNTQENSTLQQQMYAMQQVPTDAMEEVNKYFKTVQNQFMEDIFSAEASSCLMDDRLHQCSSKANLSGKQWEDTQSCINGLCKGSIMEIESNINKNIDKHHTLHKEFQSAVSRLNSDIGAKTNDIAVAIKDSLLQDKENKKEIDSLVASCLEQLKSVQERHGESTSCIRSEAEKYLVTEYLVDEQPKPRRREVVVPSLGSIEEMRTPSKEAVANPIENGSSRWSLSESKVMALTPPNTNRTPFAYVN